MTTAVGTQLFFTLFLIYRGNNTNYLLCFINSPQTFLIDLKRRLTQEVQSSIKVHLTDQHSQQNELGQGVEGEIKLVCISLNTEVTNLWLSNSALFLWRKEKKKEKESRPGSQSCPLQCRKLLQGFVDSLGQPRVVKHAHSSLPGAHRRPSQPLSHLAQPVFLLCSELTYKHPQKSLITSVLRICSLIFSQPVPEGPQCELISHAVLLSPCQSVASSYCT